MSLQNPLKKMSKSDENERAFISMLDDEELIRRKIKSAQTDSENKITYDEQNKPGIANLLSIFSLCTGESIQSLVEKYEDKGYGQFKEELAEVMIDTLRPIQQKYYELINSSKLDQILDIGAVKANEAATNMLHKVERAMGLSRT